MLRKKKRLCKLILKLCSGILCLGLLLKSIATTFELQSYVMVSDRVNKERSLKSSFFDLSADNLKKNSKRKFWYEPKNLSIPLGPGEQGSAFSLPFGLEKKKEELFKINGFNALASDFIALNRSLPDIRHLSCKTQEYLSKLPKVSIIIPFHNEHWSTLLRTVTSVVNRSPTELIEEIILVDDFSRKEELKTSLDHFCNQHFAKVRIIRAKKREGLIRARLIGAKIATGEVLIFLDSHTEANVNWLPPLLEPIATNNKTVTCPFIDVIDYETLSYRSQDEGARGSFDWELYYKRLPLLPEDLKHPSKPFRNPVMSGGLFAIHKMFFWSLGGYDEGLDVWGGEQYELSFKIWQCGGQLLDIPCSRVGHVYRKFAPFPNPGMGDFVGRNYKRVAEVWMDEYKEYLYMRKPHYKSFNVGNLTEQKALRRKLKCKPFRWYIENVAFDQPRKYPPVEPPDYARGEIRNVLVDLCIDSKFRKQNEKIELEKCINKNIKENGEQQFILTWHKDIRPLKRGGLCFDVSSSEKYTPVILYSCHGMQGNQLWKYDMENMHIMHLLTGNCMDCSQKQKRYLWLLVMETSYLKNGSSNSSI